MVKLLYLIKIYILLKYCEKIKKDRFTATLHIMNLRHLITSGKLEVHEPNSSSPLVITNSRVHDVNGTQHMSAHLCAHPGVRSAPSHWRCTAWKWRDTVKKISFVPLHFQFASGASRQCCKIYLLKLLSSLQRVVNYSPCI